MKTSKKKKPLIAGSLAIALGVSVASGTLPAQCLGNNNYACFKYGSSYTLESPSSPEATSWESFSQGVGSNKFTSNSNRDGQFVAKDAPANEKFLGIGLQSSSLILQSLSTTQIAQGLHDKNPIMIYIDVTKRTNDQNIFQLQTKDSVLVGNIQIRDVELEKNPSGSSSGSTNDIPVATLIFEGNKAIDSTTDLQYIQTSSGSITGIVRDPTSNGSYAFVGGLFNSSGRVVNVNFLGGAKMFGDFYTTSSGNSKTVATFKGGSSTTVFDGGIQVKNGTNSITFNEGNVNAVSATFGNYGIWAEGNGNNYIFFGDGINSSAYSQTLTTSGIVAKSTAAEASSTSNTIIFQNQQANNKISIAGSLLAESGINTILTIQTGTSISMTVDEGIVARKNDGAVDYRDFNIKNRIVINGSLSVGEKTMLTYNKSTTLGITTNAGQTLISLKNTTNVDNVGNIDSAISANYVSTNSLSTPRIYSTNKNKYDMCENLIRTEGDITLFYVRGYGTDTMRDTIVGGDILAADGGKNEITLNGVFKVQGYQPKTSPSDGIYNEKITSDGTTIDAQTMLISAYNGNSTNIITVKNTDTTGTALGSGNQDVVIGSVSATGGTNTISLYAGKDTGTNNNNKKVTIHSLRASDTKTSGASDTGGKNEIYIKNGTIEIKDIVTQNGGSNIIGISRSTFAQGSLKFSEYGVAGENKIYLGRDSSSNDSTVVAGKKMEAVEIVLDNSGVAKTLQLDFNIKGTNALDLTVGDGTNKSYFDGKIAYADGTSSISGLTLNYTVKKASIFLVNTQINTEASTTTTSDLTLEDGAKFILKDQESLSIKKLTLSQSTTSDTDYSKSTDSLNSTVVDLATNGITDMTKVATIRGNTSRILNVTQLALTTITNASAPLLRLYTAGVGKTDTINLANKVNTNRVLDVQVFLSADMLNHDFGADTTKTVIFREAGTTAETTKLDLGSKTKLATTGFTTYSLGITKETDGSDTVWRLGDVQDKQVNTEAVEYTTSAMGINYGIFVQNLNSLNKRMGELRNNDNTQGVWARIFGGQSTNTMDLIPAKSSYVTIQGGYDYGFGVTGGTNYVGVALSYGYTSSETDRSTNSIASITGYSSKSNNIEVALYNSYIQDEGWFSDTIAKFSYIMSNFDIYEQEGSQNQNLNNFAFSLGEEVGYRFALGSEKNWFIDPQIELVAGYISGTDLSQNQGGQVLNGKLDSVFLFRTRVGSDFGYSLKKEKNQYDFRLGLSYEYDVANADASFNIASASRVFSNAIDNDGRVVLNIGTNMKFGDNVRVYFDFEKSFVGKITTDYQLNLGARYSFGEKIARVETNKENKITAPLRIEGSQTQEDDQNTQGQVQETQEQNQ